MYFLRQDYLPAAELLIVDDGEDSIADIVPSSDRIRYLRLDPPHSLGAKRNHACRLTSSDIIALWDDDDWMAPDRLKVQVARLVESGRQLSCPGTLLHFDVQRGCGYRYRPAGGPPARGPLLFWRSVWQRSPFANRNEGTERPLVASLPGDQILIEPDDRYYLKIIHPGAMSARNMADASWSTCGIGEVVGRLNGDASFYAQLEARRPAARTAPRYPTVTFAAPVMVYDGYGAASEYLALGMERAGAEVNVLPFRLDKAGLSDEFLALLERSGAPPASPTLCFTWPAENLARFHGIQDLFLSTMWETSKLPAGWAERINQAKAVIVPSTFNADLFPRCGVRAPIEVVPLGVNPLVYRPLERPARGLTTLTVGTFVPRKNIEIGIAAWTQAFADDRDARLIIKTRFGVQKYVPSDPRILFVDSEEPTSGIAHWFSRADVLLALGNEGFGMPLVEGMATGLPVIALATEGQADLCREAGNLVLGVGAAQWVPFSLPPFGECGVRAVPSVDAVAAKLRWVATHRDEARAIGRAASAWAVTHRNIWSVGPRVLDVIERHALSKRPLRRPAPVATTIPAFG